MREVLGVRKRDREGRGKDREGGGNDGREEKENKVREEKIRLDFPKGHIQDLGDMSPT